MRRAEFLQDPGALIPIQVLLVPTHDHGADKAKNGERCKCPHIITFIKKLFIIGNTMRAKREFRDAALQYRLNSFDHIHGRLAGREFLLTYSGEAR